MTSNPAIFEKAITAGDDYNDIIKAPDAKSSTAMALYEKIAIRDVQDAADIFRAAHQETKGRDGYVSLEVSPNLAFDTQATLDEARRLWKAVNRPNVMIKIPGTPQGVPAIRQALEEGININITLLFAQSAYEQVAEAYLAALEARAAKGQDVSQIASVASFFVSRIDSLVDSTIDAKQKIATDSGKKAQLESLRGKIAIANARRTYAKYQEMESIGGQRGADAAAAVGEHQHQESQVPRRALRGRADRRRHGGHDSAGYLRCFPRSWQAAQQPHRKRRWREQDHDRHGGCGNFHEGSYGQATG
jgi:transaldolase / glucose-6-phosphate isomerase